MGAGRPETVTLKATLVVKVTVCPGEDGLGELEVLSRVPPVLSETLAVLA